MKTLLTITLLFLSINAYAQDINGKLGTNGQFIIRDTNNTFLSLSQSTGNLSLNRSLILPVMHEGSQVGAIFRGVDRFIHNYRGAGTYGENTFLGIKSGNFTLSGFGFEGSWNTATGCSTLTNLTTGGQNCAYGYSSLFSNSVGQGNSAFGTHALSTATTGNYNTAIGSYSGTGLSTGSNNIAIGYFAQLPSGTGSNQVRIGNSNITYAGIQVAWTITSDRKWKENILPSKLGLSFVSKLKPVSYERKNDDSHKTEFGLIAQDVEEVLKEEGVENSGMLTVDAEGRYELRYNDLLAPMIKAIQELKAENDELKKQNDELNRRLEKLESSAVSKK